jgi:hypothetical protein
MWIRYDNVKDFRLLVLYDVVPASTVLYHHQFITDHISKTSISEQNETEEVELFKIKQGHFRPCING